MLDRVRELHRPGRSTRTTSPRSRRLRRTTRTGGRRRRRCTSSAAPMTAEEQRAAGVVPRATRSSSRAGRTTSRGSSSPWKYMGFVAQPQRRGGSCGVPVLRRARAQPRAVRRRHRRRRPADQPARGIGQLLRRRTTTSSRSASSRTRTTDASAHARGLSDAPVVRCRRASAERPAGAAAALTLLRYSDLSRRARRAHALRRLARRRDALAGYAPAARVSRRTGHRFADDEHRPSYATAAAWGTDVARIDGLRVLGRTGPATHLDRRRFDAALAGLVAERGARVFGWRARAGRRDATLRRLAAGRCATTARRVARPACAAPDRRDRARRRRSPAGQGARRVIDDRLVGVVGVLRRRSEPVACDGYDRSSSPTLHGWWYAVPLERRPAARRAHERR